MGNIRHTSHTHPGRTGGDIKGGVGAAAFRGPGAAAAGVLSAAPDGGPSAADAGA